MRRLTHAVLVFVAILFLVEAWLWRHLGPVVEAIVERIPLRTIKAAIARLIRRLPPAATLVVFIVPLMVLFPLKVAGVWLLAQQRWLAACALLVFAKLAGVGVTAFVFDVARPKLLRLHWFRWLYEHVLVWLDRAHRLVDPVKERVRRYVHLLRSHQAARALRLLRRLRRRVRVEEGVIGPPVRTGAPRGARTAQSP